ncbi:MAG: SWIM zinc finger family protein [Thermaerobacter sp.]|nr:SWIM zinc finger family protein [Thermaerobacter sp.]
MSREAAARLALLVDALGGARQTAAAWQLREGQDVRLAVRPTAAGVVLEGAGEGWRAEAEWGWPDKLRRLRAAEAGLPPAALLLPQRRSLDARCGCGAPGPCAHALAALLALGEALAVQPGLLWTGGQAVVPAGTSSGDPAPHPPPRVDAFWDPPPPPPPLGDDSLWERLPPWVEGPWAGLDRAIFRALRRVRGITPAGEAAWPSREPSRRERS